MSGWSLGRSMAAEPLRARLAAAVAFGDYRQAFSPYSRDVHRRLHEYVGTLPESGRATLAQIGSGWLSEEPGQEIVKPYSLFIAEFFGITDPAAIGRASLAGNLMQLHCWLQDSRIDGDWPATQCGPASDALSNLLMTDSLAIFAEVAADPKFWGMARGAFCELADAYAAEECRNLAGDALLRAVLGRSAPFHILVAALGLHAQRPDLIRPCVELADRLLLWFQILDDLSDWRDDRAHGRQPYAMTLIARFLGGQAFSQTPEDEIADALYLFGGGETLIDECIRLLREAFDLLRRYSAAPSPSESQVSLHRWLPILIDAHEEVRRWSIRQKREFLEIADTHR